jgi:Nitrile hydratase beta subunit
MSDLHNPIDPRRAHHDMGGLPAAAVEATEHDYALWEKRIDAILTLLSNKRLMTVDEMRKNIESLGADAYDQMSYYERWIYAAAQTMIQHGVVTVDELGRKIAEVQGRANAFV